MNSEELELSLKAEFESYLNDLFTGMRENAADLQKNFEAEFEKHRAQLDEATRLFAERFENAPKLEPAFAIAVTEHLRLAKDSGAELAAMAFSEAEKLQSDSPAGTNYASIRDAINDISSKTSQSTILTALVEHAAKFAPRGVFFIVKNDSFVGWKRFGHDRPAPEDVAGVKFSAGNDTVMARAIGELRTADGAYSETGPDRVFIDPLDLGRPDRMYAIPLVARGRGVAVMYVDYGVGGTNLSIEALETLVRVAGLTVELLAASQTAGVPVQATSATDFPVAAEEVRPVSASDHYEQTFEVAQESESAGEVTYGFDSGSVEATSLEAEQQSSGVFAEYEMETSSDRVSVEEIDEPRTDFEFEAAVAVAENVEVADEAVEGETFVTESAFEVDANEPVYADVEVIEASEVEPASSDLAFEPNDSFETASSYAEPEPEPAEVVSHEPEVVTNGFQVEAPVAPVAEVSQPPVRFSDRNMDLPIEVPDEERRLHNDARRFARLLVSEIKLYNEQKVSEGRESGDLYDRLREAIDRSREMYEKRVQPTVASKFDYFHYELVNNLAEGQEQKLGHSYVATPV